ncbi:MAG TPA: nuclear transport factor 2 family protein [Amycolatopsis sp.]|nr:nuclear transport factor 2 family protein [Amycolatopsis sp.]
MQAWEIEARLDIARTMSRYTHYVDTGDATALAGLFTEHCHYDMGGGVVAVDSATIEAAVERLKEMFRNAPGFGRVRHHVSSVTVDLRGPDRAKAMSYFVAMSRTGPDHWGTYRDELVRTANGWLFSRRVVTVEGAAPSSPVHSLEG